MSVNALRSILLLAGVAAAALLGTSTVASAAPAAASSCPPEALCLYDGVNFTGDEFTVSSFDPSGTCVSLVDHGWGDRAHSAINTHTNTAAMFMNDDCLSGPYFVPGNSNLPDFGPFTPKSVWVPAS